MRVVNESGIGRNTKVYIDGQDVSGCFNGFQVSADIKSVVEGELSLVMAEVEFYGDTQLRLSSATHDVLVKFGWTPPAVEIPDAG